MKTPALALVLAIDSAIILLSFLVSLHAAAGGLAGMLF